MSNSGHDHGCAVHPDDTLKDASEIDWDYDPDETHAPADSTAAALPTNSPSRIHPFFAGRPPPTIKLAGARRSVRTTRPSARASDPNNMMSTVGSSSGMQSSTAAAKRKASGPAPSRRIVRKVIAEPSSDGESGDEIHAPSTAEATNVEESGGPDTGEYESLKAMADVDHRVSVYFAYILHY